MRPHYETRQDRANEEWVKNFLLKTYNIVCHKLPESYRLDYQMNKGGKLYGFCEIKCRNCLTTTYASIILSLSKWETGIRLATVTYSRFVILIKFQDGLMSYTYSKSSQAPEVEFGGRTKNTRDASDIEPVVLLPVSEMRQLTQAIKF